MIPTQRALIYLWVAAKSRSPSDLAHFHRVGSTHSAHIAYQIWSKSNTTRPSYKRFPTQRAIIHIWISGRLKEHLYTFELPPKRIIPPIELIFTGQHHNTLAMFPTKFHPNPTPLIRVTLDFRLKEHLYTFELPPKRDPPPIELIFTGQIAHIVHMSPSKSHPNPTPFVRVIKWFQLKEHLYTFELPPNRDPPPI